MIIDNKIDGFPLVAKVMSVIPLFIGTVMISSSLLFLIILGICLIIVSLALLTAEERIKVDFIDKRYKSYFSVLGIHFGKWEPLKSYDILTLTIDSTTYREVNYAQIGTRQIKVPLMTFTDNKVVLNLKRGKNRLAIAKGTYQKMYKLSIEITEYLDVEIHDFIGKE